MYMLLNVQVLNDGNLCGWNCGTRALSNCYEDRIKDALGQNYAAHFSKTPFALKGGLPGTTARLTAWWLDRKPRHGAQHLSLTDPCFLPAVKLEVWSIGQGGEQRRSTTVTGGIVAAIPGSTRTSRSWAGRGSRSGNNLHGGSSWAMIEGCWTDSLLVLWESLIYESGIRKKSRNPLKSAYIMLNLAGSPAKLAYV